MKRPIQDLNRLSPEVIAALRPAWWMDSAPFQSAIRVSLLHMLGDTIHRALFDNERRGVRPTTFTELASLIGRNKSNVLRWAKAQSQPSLADQYVLAMALGIELSALIPRSEDVLAAAITKLTGAPASESRLFAKFMAGKDVSPEHDGVVISIASAIETAILKAEEEEEGRRIMRKKKK